MPRAASKKCRIPDCRNDANGSRGVCTVCYRGLANEVHSGKTSWDALEKAGLILPRYDKANSKNPAVRAVVAAGLLSDSPSTPTPTPAQ